MTLQLTLPRGVCLQPAVAARLARLRQQFLPRGFAAQVGMVLGSGFGELAASWQIDAEVAFADIEGLPAPSVVGHGGRLLHVRAPRPALILAGRLHAYEGHSLADVVQPIGLLWALGCRVLVLTNAAGGLRADFAVGDFLALTDLIDLRLQDSLRGVIAPANDGDSELQLRALAPGQLFDPHLTRLLQDVALRRGLPISSGVYASISGPSYETGAEIALLRRLGADAVGMSTGPEAVLARALGMRVLGISCITNVAREQQIATISHAEVVAVGAARRQALGELLLELLPDLDAMACE